MGKQITTEEADQWYEAGYKAGLEEGVDHMPEDDNARYWYKRGYDAGVAEYCRRIDRPKK
jgi:hypothetical protein